MLPVTLHVPVDTVNISVDARREEAFTPPEIRT
jgi:hypothetical protein